MLTKKQILTLLNCYVRPAWKHQRETNPTTPDTPHAFDDWRHSQVLAAVGRPGLRACANSDYCALVAHFAALAGREDEALRWLLRADGDRRRRIETRLVAAMERGGYGPSYAQRIARDKFGRAVEDLDERELVDLSRTITARGSARA